MAMWNGILVKEEAVMGPWGVNAGKQGEAFSLHLLLDPQPVRTRELRDSGT